MQTTRGRFVGVGIKTNINPKVCVCVRLSVLYYRIVPRQQYNIIVTSIHPRGGDATGANLLTVFVEPVVCYGLAAAAAAAVAYYTFQTG